jgi:hypothetical protein
MLTCGKENTKVYGDVGSRGSDIGGDRATLPETNATSRLCAAARVTS